MPSDTERLRRWLADIARHITMAEDFVGELSLEEFGRDNLRLYAVVRCLEIISEASRRLPNAFKERHPSIPWREMAAAGNVYRHEYGGVASQRVWTTVKDGLPALRTVVVLELTALG